MKCIYLITIAVLVLAVSLLSITKGEVPLRWEYAKLSYGIYSDWSWTQADVFVEGDDVEELCRNMEIIKPPEKGNLYTIAAWAGAGGWEMTVATKMPQEYATIWFKRPY